MDTNLATAYINPESTKIIQCTKDSSGNKVTCTCKDGATSTTPKVHYIEGAEEKKIITCLAEASGITCDIPSDNGVSDAGFAYRDYINDGNVIIYASNGGTCTSAASVAEAAVTGSTPSPVQTANSIDAYDDNKKTLITCSKEGSQASCSSTTFEEAFPDGHAFLDGTQYNSGFTGILVWDSDENKVAATVNPSTTGYAYIDGSDDNLKRIISCDGTKCKAIDNDAKPAAADGIALNKFYIDGTDKTKMIVCTAATGCQSNVGTEDGSEVDGYYPDSQNTANVITCAADNGDCASAAHSATTAKYYTDGYQSSNLVKCLTSDGCVEVKGNTTPGYGYLDSVTAGNIIVCREGESDGVTCASQANGFKTDHNPGFLDACAENPKKTLITCTSETACTSTPLTKATQGHAFLDGTSIDDEGNFTNLITCTVDSGECAALAETSATPNTEDGYVYIDGSATANYPNIITCSEGEGEEEGTVEAGATDTEVGYIDATDTTATKIITCPSGKCASLDNVSKEAEKGADNTVSKAAVNIYYINGVDKTHIIVCTKKAGCQTIVGSGDEDDTTYFPHPDTTVKDKIISCENGKECEAVDHEGKTGSAYYLDGYVPENILICDATNGCVSSLNLATDKQPTHYIDSGHLDEPTIITCTPDQCTSGTGNTDPGTAYLDPIDSKNVVTCTEEEGCTLDVGASTDADTYIDAGDASQIIYCTARECTYFPTGPLKNNSEYYARLVASEKKSTCVLDDADAPQPNSVYVNALFGKEGGDTTNPLIICDTTPACIPSKATITGSAKSYYINSDLESVKATLDNDIIVCTGESEKCDFVKGAHSDVYLNANFDAEDNPKQIIMCTTDLGCLEYATNSTSAEIVYYINAGHAEEDPLKDTLIECADECQPLAATDGDIYINEFDPSQLIQCAEDTGCTTKKSNASPAKKEIYLNSSDLSKNDKTEHKSDLIICSHDGEKVECVAEDGQENGVYINSGANGEVIKCLKGNECIHEKVEPTADAPLFYVNGDPTNETDEPLKNDLIRCKKTDTSVTCEVVSGREGDVYLNANYHDDETKGDNLNHLIFCTVPEEEDTAGGCQPVPSHAEDESLPEYYVNAGSVQAAKLNDTLIQCQYDTSSTKCAIKQAEANNVFVNYGVDKEDRPLIKYSNNSCKSSVSNANEDNKEYYLNSGDSDDSALSYDIIECSQGDDDTVTCVELEEVKEGVYLNSNYSEAGDKMQLIQCSSESGCEGVATSTDAKVYEYFVNAE
ncbi:hypothetical protein PIROE2DRAFT_6600, partial [Piromyces sp. E2]